LNSHSLPATNSASAFRKCPQSFLSVNGRGDVAEILHRIPNAAPVIEIVGTRPSRIVVRDFVANTRAIARASSWSFSSGTIRLARPREAASSAPKVRPLNDDGRQCAADAQNELQE
jgi:hypothetical protein